MTVTYVQKTIYKVADFISWQKSHYLVLVPYFQRRPVWKPGAKSYLIDTIVRGLPIPIIFLRDRRTDPNQIEPIREVVDGQQRLRTVLGYVSPTLLPDYNPKRDSFTVKKTHNKDIAGKSFDELDDESKRAILDYEFVVHILPSRIDDREVIQIFRRMNSTNFSLTEQEKRNSKYFGEFKTSVYELAAEQLQRWRQWKIFTEDVPVKNLYLIPKITTGDRWWHQPYNPTFNQTPHNTMVGFETMNYYESSKANMFPTFPGQYFQAGIQKLLLPENNNLKGSGYLAAANPDGWATRDVTAYVLYRLSPEAKARAISRP